MVGLQASDGYSARASWCRRNFRRKAGRTHVSGLRDTSSCTKPRAPSGVDTVGMYRTWGSRAGRCANREHPVSLSAASARVGAEMWGINGWGLAGQAGCAGGAGDPLGGAGGAL